MLWSMIGPIASTALSDDARCIFPGLASPERIVASVHVPAGPGGTDSMLSSRWSLILGTDAARGTGESGGLLLLLLGTALPSLGPCKLAIADRVDGRANGSG